MCKVMEDMRKESAEHRSVEIAKNLLQLGKLTFEEIASSAGLHVVRLSRIGKKITRKNGIKQLAFYQSGFKLFKSVLVKSRRF